MLVKTVVPHHWDSRAPSLGQSCPIIGTVVPHHWDSRAPSLGQSCPIIGTVMPHHWDSRAPSLGQSCPNIGTVVPQHWDSRAPTLGQSCPHHWDSRAPSLGEVQRLVETLRQLFKRVYGVWILHPLLQHRNYFCHLLAVNLVGVHAVPNDTNSLKKN